jgi:hypothetical protein
MRMLLFVLAVLCVIAGAEAAGVAVSSRESQMIVQKGVNKTVQFYVQGGERDTEANFSVMQFNGSSRVVLKEVLMTLWSSSVMPFNVTMRTGNVGQYTVSYTLSTRPLGNGSFLSDVVTDTLLLDVVGNVTQNATNVSNATNATKPKPKSYSFSISTSPVVGKIYVDGSYIGLSPIVANVSNGSHQFKAVAQAGAYYDEVVTQVVGANGVMNLVFERVPLTSGSGGGGGGGGVIVLVNASSNKSVLRNATVNGSSVVVNVSLPAVVSNSGIPPVESDDSKVVFMGLPSNESVVENETVVGEVVGDRQAEGKTALFVIMILGVVALVFLLLALSTYPVGEVER